jgi:methyl-accepting chemotaxis protein
VEAARAGEAGMGFAVVADEVRNLAQRSAQAARDTATLIEESIAKAESGNAKVEVVATAIAGITDSVTKVKGLVEQVSAASRQQSQGIDQVSQAISQMEKVTQTTAATAEESAAASEELTAQADGAMQVVGRLEVLVGSTGATVAPRPASRKSGASKAAARVLQMNKPAAFAPTAEEQLPMESTGTFGKF